MTVGTETHNNLTMKLDSSYLTPAKNASFFLKSHELIYLIFTPLSSPSTTNWPCRSLTWPTTHWSAAAQTWNWYLCSAIFAQKSKIQVNSSANSRTKPQKEAATITAATITEEGEKMIWNDTVIISRKGWSIWIRRMFVRGSCFRISKILWSFPLLYLAVLLGLLWCFAWCHVWLVRGLCQRVWKLNLGEVEIVG